MQSGLERCNALLEVICKLWIDQKYVQARLEHLDIDTAIYVYESVTDLMRVRGRVALNNMY